MYRSGWFHDPEIRRTNEQIPFSIKQPHQVNCYTIGIRMHGDEKLLTKFWCKMEQILKLPSNAVNTSITEKLKSCNLKNCNATHQAIYLLPNTWFYTQMMKHFYRAASKGIATRLVDSVCHMFTLYNKSWTERGPIQSGNLGMQERSAPHMENGEGERQKFWTL